MVDKTKAGPISMNLRNITTLTISVFKLVLRLFLISIRFSDLELLDCALLF